MPKYYNTAQKWYITALLIYLSARNILFLRDIVSSGIWTIVFFAAGLLLAAYQIIKDPKCLAAPQMDFMLLFYLATAVSCVVNIQYGFADNIKALAMMFLFFFFWFPLSAVDKDERDRLMRHIAVTVSSIWFVLCVLSVVMYLFAIDYEVVGGVWGETNQGFSSRYMRLWGVFHDPNYAGAGCIATIFSCIYLCSATKKRGVIAGCAVNIVFQMFYIALSGSRSTVIVLICAVTCYCLYHFMSGHPAVKEKAVKAWGRAAAMSAVCVVVCYALVQAILYGAPYLQRACCALPDAVVKGVCSAYESAYESSDLTFLSKNSIAVERNLLEGITAEQDPEDEEDADVDETTDESEVNSIKRTDSDKFDTDVSNGRFTRWSDMLQVFKSAPVFGTSPKNLAAFAKAHNPDTRMAKYNMAAHNSYLEVLTSTGLVGMAALLLLLGCGLVPILKKYFMFDGDPTFILATVICLEQALTGIFISDLFFLFSIGSNLFWMSYGFAVHCGPESTRTSYVYQLTAKVLKRKDG